MQTLQITTSDLDQIHRAFNRQPHHRQDLLRSLAIQRHAAEIRNGERLNASIHGESWYRLRIMEDRRCSKLSTLRALESDAATARAASMPTPAAATATAPGAMTGSTRRRKASSRSCSGSTAAKSLFHHLPRSLNAPGVGLCDL